MGSSATKPTRFSISWRNSPITASTRVTRRLNPREVNKKVLESLAAAGAFDEIEPDRAKVFASVETLLAIAHRGHEDREAGQVALFGEANAAPIHLPNVEPWPIAERLRR